MISGVPAQMVDRALVANRSQDPLMLRASGQGCLILVIIDHFVFSAQVAQLLSQRQWRPGAWFQFTQERMVDDPVYGQ